MEGMRMRKEKDKDKKVDDAERNKKEEEVWGRK